jgi:SNF2 family DNA or RNA helicase
MKTKNIKELKLNKSIVFDKNEKRIFLQEDVDKFIKLNPTEIFNFFQRKQKIQGVNYEEIKIENELANLKIIKNQSEIIFTIEIGAESSVTFCELNSYFSQRNISLTETKLILKNEYFISNNEIIPVCNESIKFAKTIINNISDSGFLNLQFSLELFSKRELNRFVKFKNHEINFKEILESKLYSSLSNLFIRNLYDYQKDGLKWLQYCILNKIGGILGDDMGLGKTAQIIAAIAWCIEKNILNHILIVVPSTLLENWNREFSFFAPSLNPYLHHGTLRTGSIETLSKQPIVITSYSMIINDQYLFNKIKWGAIILDEASQIKNPNSERKIALMGIESEIKIAMTGTPVENTLLDLWSICDFCMTGYLGDLELFNSKYIKKSIEQTLNESDLISLRNDISFIMLRRKKEDVLDSLPDKFEIHQALQMNESEAIRYNEERERILSQIDKENPATIFSLIQNLRQFTTHPMLLEGNSIETASIKVLKQTSTKFTRIIEIIDEISFKKEKVIIFTEYLKMIDTFRKILNDNYGIEILTIDGRVETQERQKRIDKFSSTKGFSIMVLNPKTAGMGLNITAANHVIHYTRQWNPALEEQASARSYRNGQKKNVNLYYLYYVNTIEELIDTKLKAKSVLSHEVIKTSNNEFSFDDYLKLLSVTPILKL